MLVACPHLFHLCYLLQAHLLQVLSEGAQAALAAQVHTPQVTQPLVRCGPGLLPILPQPLEDVIQLSLLLQTTAAWVSSPTHTLTEAGGSMHHRYSECYNFLHSKKRILLV